MRNHLIAVLSPFKIWFKVFCSRKTAKDRKIRSGMATRCSIELRAFATSRDIFDSVIDPLDFARHRRCLQHLRPGLTGQRPVIALHSIVQGSPLPGR